MKKLLLLSMLTLNITNSFCQNLKRNIAESAQQFVVRTMTSKNSKIAGKVIETKWNSEVVLVTFIAVEQIQKADKEQFTETNVEGYVLIPIGKNVYKKVFIDSYGEEGAVAEIESIFFANADKDKQKELIVLCSWNQDGHAPPISGRLYQTYFYDNLNSKKLPDVLTKLDLGKKLPLEFDGTNDAGEMSKAKYTSAAKVKQRLKQLGL